MLLGATITTLLIAGGLILLHERIGLLSCDRFPTIAHKIAAYALLVVFVFVVAALVILSSQSMGELVPEELSFYELFVFHLIMVMFLVVWWLLTDRPSFGSYLNIDRRNALEMAALGVGVGVGGWVLTIMIAMLAGLIVVSAGVSTEDLQPSPMIPWMVGLAWWQKGMIVLSAMTIEEAFYRGWLQKRTGLIFSTIVFAISHAGYGQPFMLIGVTTISLVIGFTFYKTRNLIPCIIAHGVFDAIQIFVVIPVAMKFAGY